MNRIEFISSVGTLGKDDPEDYQVCSFGCFHVAFLRGAQKVTVFSPDGAYLAVAGSSEVCSLAHIFHFPNEHFALVVLVNRARARIHQYAGRQG